MTSHLGVSFSLDSRILPRILLIGTLFVVTLILSACTVTIIEEGPPPAQDDSSDAAGISEEGSVIKIGVRTALSGPVANQGQEISNAVELAVREWNARGGAGGFSIEVVQLDDAGNPDQGVAVSEEACGDDQIIGVIGSFQSAVGIPSSELLSDCGIVYIAPGETNPMLTDRELPGVNRVSPRDDDQGPALAIYAREYLEADYVYVISDQSAGGQGLADAFIERADDLGMRTELGFIDVGETDFREMLATIPEEIDALVFYGFLPEGALIAEQWHELGNEQPVLGGDPLFEPEGFIAAAGDAAEGAIVTFIGPDIYSVPAAEEFLENFEADYGPIRNYGPQAYEAANILLAAIDQTGSNDRAAVRESVRNTANFEGILGTPITFDEKGDVEGGTIYVFRVENGTFVQTEAISTR